MHGSDMKVGRLRSTGIDVLPKPCQIVHGFSSESRPSHSDAAYKFSTDFVFQVSARAIGSLTTDTKVLHQQ